VVQQEAVLSAWEALGKSDEWYTPKYIFDALGVHFDLDVAAPTRRTHVPALRFITSESLDLDWSGFVWMNPPYGGRNSLGPWLEKFVNHGNGICLVPDRTSAPWFQKHAPSMDAVLFVKEKIKFERPDGSVGKQPGTGSALMAKGPRGVKALRRASSLGWCVANGDFWRP
jgi:hypothetical protein